jgi:segregation and condensation protein B
MSETHLKNVIEAALLAAGKPLQLTELSALFEEHARPDNDALRTALDALVTDYEGRGIEVKETATGFRIQVRKEFAPEISRLWPERPPRYSRALLETLALIAYRQPITRAEIEGVRGVAVNPNIIKTLLERGWVRVVGTRDVPGRPELLGTTREFLDYFSLRSLDELPPLAELKTMTDPNLQLALNGATPAAAVPVEGIASEASTPEVGESTAFATDVSAAIESGAMESEAVESAEAAKAEAVEESAVAEEPAEVAETIEAAEAVAAESAPQSEPAIADEPVVGDETALNEALHASAAEPVDEEEESERSNDVAQKRKVTSTHDLSGFDDDSADDEDERKDSDGDSAELVAARRDYED